MGPELAAPASADFNGCSFARVAAMPREPAISPSGNALRRNKNRRSKNWPAATGFCEESAPGPNPQYFQVVARRIAEQVAAWERPVYVRAVVGEAVNRLLNLSRVATTSRKVLKEYRHRYEVVPGEVLAHVQHIQREMAWERAKWSVQHNAYQWRRYATDSRFLSWLQSVSTAELRQWAAAYLPDAAGQSPSARCQSLAQLAPMPVEIRRAYFFATAPEKQIRSIAGAKVEFNPLAEQHVCLVCQRLLAYHSAMHARHGPAHLAAILRKRAELLRRGDRAAREMFNAALEAGLHLQGRVTKAVVDAVMPRVDAALQRAQAILLGERDLRTELAVLRPTQLMLTEPCATCGPVRAVVPDEWYLPPFHSGCQCFRLAWRGGTVPELERKTTLWALERALAHHDRPQPRFPFEEFIEACELRRADAVARSVTEAPYPRERSNISPRQALSFGDA